MRFLKVYFQIITFLVFGFLIATQVNGFLRITYRQKNTPESGVNIPMLNASDTLKPLAIRLIDLGGVGIIPDTNNWGNNYEHNVHRFEDMILAASPFIDTIAFARVEKELR